MRIFPLSLVMFSLTLLSCVSISARVAAEPSSDLRGTIWPRTTCSELNESVCMFDGGAFSVFPPPAASVPLDRMLDGPPGHPYDDDDARPVTHVEPGAWLLTWNATEPCEPSDRRTSAANGRTAFTTGSDAGGPPPSGRCAVAGQASCCKTKLRRDREFSIRPYAKKNACAFVYACVVEA